ncbi:unnamed protein product [Echinostoma caproni]|uniref:SAM domain-containing protein n=1 Tax=Echinostoma caproni TaxID=27848 RepID=A0A3P8L2E3_9TREM|nr:unnamed protein product [Echinostoma caproni]
MFPDTSQQSNIPGTYDVSSVGEVQPCLVDDTSAKYKASGTNSHLSDSDVRSDYSLDRDHKLGPPQPGLTNFGNNIASATLPQLHEYALHHHQFLQQQSLATGMSGIPIKRKRGRPRKYATMHVLHSTQNHTRAIQPFSPPCTTPSVTGQQSTPVPSPTLPNPPYPYSTVLLGQTQAAMTSPPALNRYAPLTVSTPAQPGGMILTSVTNVPNNNCQSGHTITISSDPILVPQNNNNMTEQSSVLVRPPSPMTVSIAEANGPSSTGNGMVLSPQSTSTEPAVHQRSTDSSQTPYTISPAVVSASTTPALPASVYPPVDFCSAQHTLNGLIPYVNGLVPPQAPIPSPKLPDPAISSSVLGWCTDSLSLNGSYQLTLAAQSNTSMLVPAFPEIPGRRYSFPSAPDHPGVSRTHHPSGATSGTWFSTDIELMDRLLPQASAALRAARGAGLPGPHSWSTSMVGNFVSTLPGCKQFANKFVENEIDGAALLCLEQHDLMQILGMKLGPAVKVFSAIQTLRRSLMATPLTELGLEQPGTMEAASSCFSVTHSLHTEVNVPSSSNAFAYSDQKSVVPLNDSTRVSVSNQSIS